MNLAQISQVIPIIAASTTKQQIIETVVAAKVKAVLQKMMNIAHYKTCWNVVTKLFNTPRVYVYKIYFMIIFNSFVEYCIKLNDFIRNISILFSFVCNPNFLILLEVAHDVCRLAKVIVILLRMDYSMCFQAKVCCYVAVSTK